ncbi:hypothetical protein WJX84_002326 [Apatococcus fuscideae]|uniref:Uncharacterized protein n=1 Tax=Apatococcus fuscideae TaxID=2026836 RepID=A0AAW1SQD2_9CHLO
MAPSKQVPPNTFRSYVRELEHEGLGAVSEACGSKAADDVGDTLKFGAPDLLGFQAHGGAGWSWQRRGLLAAGVLGAGMVCMLHCIFLGAEPIYNLWRCMRD